MNAIKQYVIVESMYKQIGRTWKPSTNQLALFLHLLQLAFFYSPPASSGSCFVRKVDSVMCVCQIKKKLNLWECLLIFTCLVLSILLLNEMKFLTVVYENILPFSAFIERDEHHFFACDLGVSYVLSKKVSVRDC